MTNDKSEALEQIRKEWEALNTVLKRVPKDRMEEPGVVGEWSVKDIIGHITTWEEIGTDRIREIALGREIVRPYDSLDAFNTELVKKKRGLPLKTIWQQFLQVHEVRVRFLDRLPEEYFKPDSPARRTIMAEWGSHYAEHAEDLRRWLKCTS